MAEDYAADRLDAHAEFTESGMPVVLRGKAGSTVDEATGKVTAAGADIEVPTVALNKDFTLKEINGTTILDRDRRVLMSAEDVFQLDVVPVVGMYLELPDGTFRIVNVRPLAPGGVAVFYTLHLRS